MTTYLVTGANRGIGLEFARQLAERGERVIATARDPGGADALNALDARVEALDVTDDRSIEGLASALAGEPIDVLINNAGVGQTAKTLDKVSPSELLRVFHVNAVGPLMTTRTLLPNLEAGEGKLVVHLSSVMGSIAGTSGGHYAYRASKAALNMLNKCMAVELEPRGIACVAMHPGWVKTEMGGAEAELEIPESVGDMLGTIGGLGTRDAGRYVDRFGADIDW